MSDVRLSPGQQDRWDRALDMVSLAAGRGNDGSAAERALRAVRQAEATGLLGASVGLAAALADWLSEILGCDVHEVLALMR